jgi:hypothetical protein
LVGIGAAIAAAVGLAVVLVHGGSFSRAEHENVSGEPTAEVAVPAPDQVDAVFPLSERSALMVKGGGFSSAPSPVPPRIVLRVDLRGRELVERWRWTLPAPDSRLVRWEPAGRVIAASLEPNPVLHEMQRHPGGECTAPPLPHLIHFDVDRGYLGELADAAYWSIDGDGTALVGTTDAAVLFREGREVWRHAMASDDVRHFVLTGRVAFYTTRDPATREPVLRVLRRDDGSVVRDVRRTGQDEDGLTLPEILRLEIVGIDRESDELLWLSDGDVVVESLETGERRTSLALGEPGSTWSPSDPRLLGVHAGRWIVFADEPHDAHTFHGALYAFDRSTGALAWRTELGALRLASAHALAVDAPLPDHLVLFLEPSDGARPPADQTIVDVSLTSGRVVWRSTFPWIQHDERAEWVRDGAASYLFYGRTRRTVARFEGGLLTAALDVGHGGVSLPAGGAIWIHEHAEWGALRGSELHMTESSEGIAAPLDARSAVVSRLALPPEALRAE